MKVLICPYCGNEVKERDDVAATEHCGEVGECAWTEVIKPTPAEGGSDE